MSTIRGATTENVYKIQKFLGMNENPDGDTKLKLGEASVCRNWKITRDWNLQKRPGMLTKYNVGSNTPVAGMWFGNVKGTDIGLAACGGHMYKFYENDYLEELEDLGLIDTNNRVNFFAYSNIVYVLNGEEYYSYDGARFGIVKGYRPLIITSRTPNGTNSTLLEEVNKLTGMRRVWFSPDGTNNEFLLPEKDLLSVDYVKINATGEYMNPGLYTSDRLNGTVTFESTETFAGDGTTTVFDVHEEATAITSVKVGGTATTAYTFSATTHKITFTSAPADEAEIVVSETVMIASGTNTIEIGYSAVNTYRNDVVKNTNVELFLGAQDNAVFLYGNGTNKAIYSSIDYWGQPRADYFPDLNEIAVADSNTPITGMIRHFSRLICYKTFSTYAIQFGLITTATGDTEYGFYVTPVNREIGNAALGQVRLVLNSPYTLFGNDLYQWTNNSRYSSNLSSDERQARRISDRVNGTLKSFEAKDCYCYDDNPGQEYYICYDDKALVYNYAADAWYLYEGLRINSMCNTHEDLLVGTSNGHICRLSTDYLNDDGTAIDCHWESGSIDFGHDYMRKLMTEIWVAVKPQAHSNVTVTVQTDKKSEFTQKIIDSLLFSFAHVDFKNFSFKINRKPQIKKLKIKAKKFAFLKLIFRTSELYSTATILSADPKIRETGYVK